jgi:hypothetical protein
VKIHIRDFDHSKLVTLPSYAKAVEAIKNLMLDVTEATTDWGLSEDRNFLGEIVAAAKYMDYCANCAKSGDVGRVESCCIPRAVCLKESHAHYECSVCSYAWTCSWRFDK